VGAAPWNYGQAYIREAPRGRGGKELGSLRRATVDPTNDRVELPIGQLGAVDHCAGEVGSTEVCPLKIGVGEVGGEEAGAAQVGVGDGGAGKVQANGTDSVQLFS